MLPRFVTFSRYKRSRSDWPSLFAVTLLFTPCRSSDHWLVLHIKHHDSWCAVSHSIRKLRAPPDHHGLRCAHGHCPATPRHRVERQVRLCLHAPRPPAHTPIACASEGWLVLNFTPWKWLLRWLSGFVTGTVVLLRASPKVSAVFPYRAIRVDVPRSHV